MVTKSVAQTPW